MGTAWREENDDDFIPAEDWLRLPEGFFGGTWLVLQGAVNINDLSCGGKPGAIVRITRPDAVRYVPPPLDSFDRVAGMISDAA